MKPRKYIEFRNSLFVLLITSFISVGQAQDEIGWDSAPQSTFGYWVKQFSLPLFGAGVVKVNQIFSTTMQHQENYELPISSAIYSLSLSGSVDLHGDASLVRVLLVNTSDSFMQR